MNPRLLLPALLALACASHPDRPATDAPASQDWSAIVNAPDRPDADKALDAGRKPAAMLSFFGVRPGMRVADLGAGGGYTTELLSRAVGPTGSVFSQNPPQFMRFAEKPWADRLAEPALKNVTRLLTPMDSPLIAEDTNLDLVVSHAIYHDTVWMGTDRDHMNRAVFTALKPGGVYVVIDSSAKPGTGLADAKSLHRIDEQTVLDEVQKAGFQVLERSDAWRNPGDTRDWSTSPGAAGARRGTGDRFAIKFVKPK